MSSLRRMDTDGSLSLPDGSVVEGRVMLTMSHGKSLDGGTGFFSCSASVAAKVCLMDALLPLRLSNGIVLSVKPMSWTGSDDFSFVVSDGVSRL